MKKTLIVFLLIMVAVSLAGCTTTPAARDMIRVHYAYNTDWSLGLGCYQKVSGYAFNAGDTTVENVALNLNLVSVPTGTIRDSRSVFIGTMGAGQSVPFEMVLDGECTQDYRIDGTIVK
jgi:hypothetical protein